MLEAINTNMTLLANSATVANTNMDVFFNDILYSGYYQRIKEQFAGGTSGFVYGGARLSPATYVTTIEKFPFAVPSSLLTLSIGSLTTAKAFVSSQGSDSYAYSSGGVTNFTGTYTNVIERFSMVNETADGASVGNLISARSATTGQSSLTHGYASGGELTPYVNTIERFPFADSSTNSTTVGGLTVARSFAAGQSSNTHGYTSGGLGLPNATILNTIDRYPFASATTDATDVGDLAYSRYTSAGNSSETTGYTSGGFETTPAGTTASYQIDSFPFASASTNATDIGDLVGAGKAECAGASSIENAYTIGGRNNPHSITVTDNIERFTMATTVTVSSVGTLTVAKYGLIGQQI